MHIKIIPLHPYSASPTFYDKTETKEKSYVIKFYFIDGAHEATDKLSDSLDSFINSFLKTDDDFKIYGGYHIDFFKKSYEINEIYRDTGGHNSIESHYEDLLFEYHWDNKKFTACEYYEKGRVIKTVTKKSFIY